MRSFILTALFLCLAVPLAGKSSAQSWITRDACTVTSKDLATVDETILTERNIAERSKATPFGIGKLWKITSPAGAISHIWGTIHSSQTIALDLPEKVVALIEAAQIVAIEIDPTHITRAEITEEYSGIGVYQANLENGYSRIPSLIQSWIDSRLQAMGSPRKHIGSWSLPI